MGRPPSLLGMIPRDLVAHLARHDVVVDEQVARRVLSSVIAHGDEAPRPRRPVGKRVLDAVTATTRLDRPRVVDEVTDPADGFTKLLLEGDEGARFEAVRIPLEKPGTYTLCLSSQVGCAMACTFCATGRLGLARGLSRAEIVGAFLAVRDRTTTGRVRGVVFMGQGEPFHNYDEVIGAARVLHDPSGARVDAKAITISTVGLVPALRRYTSERHPYKLIVSLTSAVPERRARLVPVAGRTPLVELRDAIRDYTRATGQRATIAWVLMGGVNDGDDEVGALAALFADVPIRVNLIDVNDARDDGFRRATDDERDRFVDGLAARGIPFVRRYSGGRERHAACGMLASLRLADAPLSALPVVDG